MAICQPILWQLHNFLRRAEHGRCNNRGPTPLRRAGTGEMRLRGRAPCDLGVPAWRFEVIYVHQARIDYPGTPFEVCCACGGVHVCA